MGAALCGIAAGILKDRMRASDENDDPDDPSDVKVFMVCIALDYPGTDNQLTCTKDGNNMMQLWEACGQPQEHVRQLFNNDGNKQQVIAAVEEISGMVSEGDYFIFYYSGHGTSVPDKDGDEEDGKDEALCLVTPQGKIDWDAFMTDDELSQQLAEHFPEQKIIILSDCCHSGTISDFDSPAWGEIQAVSISGCTDDQTSGDTGNGGIFTHSLLMAIADFSNNDNASYSVGQLYNKTLEFDDSVFNSEQDITAAKSTNLASISGMAWPLIPQGGYQAPWSQ
jgi:hypothetical protein